MAETTRDLETSRLVGKPWTCHSSRPTRGSLEREVWDGGGGWQAPSHRGPGGHSHRIARALERLRKDFDQPLRIEDITQELEMSVSGFHHHFKAVTTMSLLQFQKQMRLQEARRTMLGEDLDAAIAGCRVGYGDASHFDREYKRLFGAPPVRDVERLREAVRERASL